jgi:hypothetical protein
MLGPMTGAVACSTISPKFSHNSGRRGQSDDKSDIDWALHQIEQMVIIARRSTQGLKASKDIAYVLMPAWEHESLEFSLGDILDKVVALKEVWDDTEQGDNAAPNAGVNGGRSGATDKPQSDREGLYGGIEGFLCDAVNMIRIAYDLVLEDMYGGDPDTLARISFAVHHSRLLLDDLKRRYDEQDFGKAATGVAAV